MVVGKLVSLQTKLVAAGLSAAVMLVGYTLGYGKAFVVCFELSGGWNRSALQTTLLLLIVGNGNVHGEEYSSSPDVFFFVFAS